MRKPTPNTISFRLVNFAANGDKEQGEKKSQNSAKEAFEPSKSSASTTSSREGSVIANSSKNDNSVEDPQSQWNEADEDNKGKRKRKSSKHQMAACCNCKRRRKKCDGRYPVCSGCQRLGTECTIIYAPTGREIRRDYLDSLEEEIEVLRKKQRDMAANEEKLLEEDLAVRGLSGEELAVERIEDENIAGQSLAEEGPTVKEGPTAVAVAGDILPANLAQQVGLISLGAAGEPRYIGETSAYSIAKAIASSITCYGEDRSGGAISFLGEKLEATSGGSDQTEPSSASVRFVKPARAAAEAYLEAYRDSVQCQYPFLDWDQVLFWFEQVMGDTNSSGPPGCPFPGGWEGNFFIYMIFAVATQLLEVNPHDTSSTKAYYNKAFESVRLLAEHTTIHAVQAYLLMAVFSQKMPDGASVWQTTGLAIRTAVALGLHRKPYRGRKRAAAGPVDKAKSRAEDIRARIFWSAYGIERINGLVLGRPFSISDVDIDAPLPLETDETRVACHVVRLRRIQSSICTFIYKPLQLLDSPKELESTRVQIVLELNDWMQTFPYKRDAKSTFETDNWSIISYHNSLLLLLRPVILEVAKLKLDAPPRYLEWFKVFTESSSAICLNYKNMYLKQKLSYTWLAMHCCFVSGISFLYCVWLDCSLHVLKWKRKSLIYDTINACSIILYVLAERWHAASIFRDTFERLSNIVKSFIETSESTKMVKENTEDILKNGVFEDGSIGIDYYLKGQSTDSERFSTRTSIGGDTDGIMFSAGTQSTVNKKAKTQAFVDDMDKLWEFLDSTGDKYLRDIFNDMEDRIGR
ncbi:DEKNAAC104479 [Brettanomyces naardenensis]|uniref:DEKNAAC104479 n=1 Tax=Brettanomyces naardenensis TaxID=13370 RepID=A0A448YRN4_BRENA|nr:DEKNAAC104479 [Brettanomyces naardenensis]